MAENAENWAIHYPEFYHNRIAQILLCGAICLGMSMQLLVRVSRSCLEILVIDFELIDIYRLTGY